MVRVFYLQGRLPKNAYLEGLGRMFLSFGCVFITCTAVCDGPNFHKRNALGSGWDAHWQPILLLFTSSQECCVCTDEHTRAHAHTHTHTQCLKCLFRLTRAGPTLVVWSEARWARIPEVQVPISSRGKGTFFPRAVGSIFRLSLTNTHTHTHTHTPG